MRYSAYGHTLESDIPLQGLSVSGGPPDLRIVRGSELAEVAELSAAPPLTDGDAPWLRLTPHSGGFALEFDGGGAFTFLPHDRSIAVHLDRRGLTGTAHHLLLDQVLPLALSHIGRLVVHASALSVDRRGVAFVGPGGIGKSTLVASFARHGGAVIADDALVIGLAGTTAVAQPAYPGVRVWPDVLATLDAPDSAPPVDGYSEKRRLGVAQGLRFESSCMTLERIYFVRGSAADDPVIGSMPNRDAVIALLTHSFVLDASDTTRLTTQLEQACRVAERTAVRTLTVPRALDRLGEVRRAICADLVS